MRHTLPSITDVVGQKMGGETVIVADRKRLRHTTRDAFVYGFLLCMVVVFLNVGQSVTTATHLKESIMAKTASAYSALVSGSKALMAGETDVANQSFTEAQTQFANLQQTIASVLPQGKQNTLSLFISGRSFFEGSAQLAQAAEDGSDFFAAFTAWAGHAGTVNQATLSGQASIEDANLTAELAIVFEKMQPLLNDLQEAQDAFRHVAINDIPEKYRPLFALLTSTVQSATETLSTLNEQKQAIMTLLGDGTAKKYMVLLQNNSEQRPTGGFIGSFLLVNIQNGVLLGFNFNDVYDYDWRLQEDVEAPEEIAALTDNWRLRDANYSPDFPTSAQQAMWFLRKEDGPAVDGVIAINLTVLEELLRLTGPVTMSRFPQPLTADNIQLVLSAVIESKLDGEESPKQIFHDLIPAVVATCTAHPPSLGNLLSTLQTLQAQGQMQAYFTDENLESLSRTLGIAGEVTQPAATDDVMQVVHTSVGGNKTDDFINENVIHKTFIGSDGALIDQVTITRTHTWTEAIGQAQADAVTAMGLPALSDAVKSILGAGTNKSALRVYVPSGAELLEATGISKNDVQTIQDPDINQTYFRFVMVENPGESSTVTISYRLPFTMPSDKFWQYHLYMRPQPGATTQTMMHQFVLSDDLQIFAERTIALTKTLGTQYAALVGRR